MGKTVPSFRIVLAEEKQEWKPFCTAPHKSNGRNLNEDLLFDLTDFLYVSFALHADSVKSGKRLLPIYTPSSHCKLVVYC
jgi:hypothetical protein